MSSDVTSERIRRASRKLFARRGVNGVSVREVVAEAGARNNGSIHYYFGSKDALVKELVMEGARAIDEYRRKALDGLEAGVAAPDLRAITAILVDSMLDDADERLEGYARFLAGVRLNQRHLANNPLEGRWSAGTRRCYAHLRRLLPGFPETVLLQRFTISQAHIVAALAERDAVRELAARPDAPADILEGATWWASRLAIDDIIDTAVALMVTPARPGAALSNAGLVAASVRGWTGEAQ
ncbi:TetR/AcrR family transcriptional regulator [Camelimonas sp. ID_303_24]